MDRRKIIISLIPVLCIGALLTACNLSFAEDITPPPGYQPPEYQSEAESETELQYPLVSPDTANGGEIYAEKCGPCHGDRGLGDGVQAGALSVPPTAIGALEISRQARPVEWYEIVTIGNIERFMPPFTSLTDRERWDVIAYVFTLGISNTRLDDAEYLYLQQCAGCHGETALGDGITAANLTATVADFSDQEKMAILSAQELFDAIFQGVAPDMPGYAGSISDDDIWALTTYLRTITFQPTSFVAGDSDAGPVGSETTTVADVPHEDEPDSTATSTDIQMEGTPLSESQSVAGIIRGQVVNGSGEDIDPDLSVMLHGYDHGDSDFVEVLTVETTVEQDGSYIFTNVDFSSGRLFLITVDYETATYGSDVVAADPEIPILEIPLVYYETTSDTSKLQADRLHIFFEIISAETMRVSQLYVVANTGFQAVVTNPDNDPILSFRLPDEATNLTFDDGTLGDRFVLVPNGFGDRRGVLPGSKSEVLFSYDMPYDRKLELDISVPIPVEAVIATLPDTGLRLESPSLQSAGSQEAEGYAYQIYTTGFLSAGSVLPIDISGRVQFPDGGIDGSEQLGIIIGVFALGVVLISLLVWWLRRTGRILVPANTDDSLAMKADSEDESTEQIMDAIIAIDDLYAAGRLPEEAYRKRRAELKSKLTKLVE